MIVAVVVLAVWAAVSLLWIDGLRATIQSYKIVYEDCRRWEHEWRRRFMQAVSAKPSKARKGGRGSK